MRFTETLDTSGYSLKELKESFLEFSASYEFSKSQNLSKHILDLTEKVSPRDTCSITLNEVDAESTFIQEFELEAIQNKVEQVIGFAEEDNFILTVTINKQQESETLSIYDFQAFTEHLSELSLASALSAFSNLLENGNGALRFNCYNLINEFQSYSIAFVKWNNTDTFEVDLSHRKQQISEITQHCHSVFDENIELVPEDFHFRSSYVLDSGLRNFADRIKLVLSVGSIFDTVKVFGNEFEFRLIGYKTISGKEDFKSLPVLPGIVLFQIYQWIYSGGNVADKIGLARNVLTLHMTDNNFELVGDPLLAIKSSYDIYLKRNIKQYLEVRNDIGNQLVNLSNETRRIAVNYVSSFEKSFIAFLGYFLSVFIARIFKSGTIEQVFNYETWLIGFWLLCVSLFFLVYSIWSFSDEVKRYKHRYENLKDRFKDLLGDDDIKRILNDDKEYKGSLEYLGTRKNLFTAVWILSLVMFLVAITWLWLLFELSEKQII